MTSNQSKGGFTATGIARLEQVSWKRPEQIAHGISSHGTSVRSVLEGVVDRQRNLAMSSIEHFIHLLSLQWKMNLMDGNGKTSVQLPPGTITKLWILANHGKHSLAVRLQFGQAVSTCFQPWYHYCHDFMISWSAIRSQIYRFSVSPEGSAPGCRSNANCRRNSSTSSSLALRTWSLHQKTSRFKAERIQHGQSIKNRNSYQVWWA